jgi:hypothetical protein
MSDNGFTQLGHGTQEVRIDGDLVVMRSHGVTTLDDLLALTAICERVRREHGSLFMMYDSRDGAGFDRAARKAFMQPNSPTVRADATSAFGTTFAIRVLLSMLDRALVAFGKAPSGVVLFDTEAEALAYLEKERVRLNKPRPAR